MTRIMIIDLRIRQKAPPKMTKVFILMPEYYCNIVFAMYGKICAFLR